MFERFTDRARETVVMAQEESRQLGHGSIGTEHLLLGLLRQSEGAGAEVLERLKIDLESTRSDIVGLVGTGPRAPLGPRDADALGTIGIDLHEVRRRVEEAFGPGALERTARGRRRRLRRGRCDQGFGGHVPFTPKAKKALELALREAAKLRRGDIGTEHILLGVVLIEGLASEILAGRGASAHRVRRAVVDEVGRGGDAPGRSA